MKAFSVGDAVWVRLYRGTEEVRMPAVVTGLQAGYGGYEVEACYGERRRWLTTESQLEVRYEPTSQAEP